jgi:hypothetical protein
LVSAVPMQSTSISDESEQSQRSIGS